MHRALTIAVVLAVVAGSVPAAASLADGTPSNAEPGASFAGVVGVQEAEVNNEVANRSLDRQLRAAGTNRSKASVVAGESQQLEQRLEELEAEKARLEEAYENGSISRGQYQARLAVLSAELRAVERRANSTADVAEQLPSEALREAGANVSHVRQIAQHANRTGGGEVAEAARQIAGNGVGDGLGNRPAHAGPPNGSEAGPPDNAGGGNNAGNAGSSGGNETGTNASERAGNDAGPPDDAASNASNATNRSGNGSGAGDAVTDVSNATNRSDNGSGAGDAVTNVSNSSENGTETDAVGVGNGTNAPENGTDVPRTETATGTSAVGRMTIV